MAEPQKPPVRTGGYVADRIVIKLSDRRRVHTIPKPPPKDVKK